MTGLPDFDTEPTTSAPTRPEAWWGTVRCTSAEEADMIEVGKPEDPTYGILRPRPLGQSIVTCEAVVVDPYNPLASRRRPSVPEHCLPEPDTEPTTGAPAQPRPWWLRQAQWLRHVAAVTIIFLVMFFTFILGIGVVYETVNPFLAMFLGFVYGGLAGLGIYWLEGE